MIEFNKLSITPDDYYTIIDRAAEYLELGMRLSYLSFIMKKNMKGDVRRDDLNVYGYNLYSAVDKMLDGFIKETILVIDRNGKKIFINVNEDSTSLIENVLEESEYCNEWDEEECG